MPDSDDLRPLWRCPDCGAWQTFAGRCRNSVAHEPHERVMVENFPLMFKHIEPKLPTAMLLTLEMHPDDRWGVEWRCGAYDDCGEPGDTFCSLEKDHGFENLEEYEWDYIRQSRGGVPWGWHADVRNGKLWAGWRGPHNGADR